MHLTALKFGVWGDYHQLASYTSDITALPLQLNARVYFITQFCVMTCTKTDTHAIVCVPQGGWGLRSSTRG